MEKQRWEESEKRREEERRSEKRTIQKTEDAGARKGSKVAKHCVFPMMCGSGGSKSRLAKAAGAEPSGEMRDEQLHAAVAQSTFPSQNVQSTPCTEHFWKLRCRKSARFCGAKQISKSNCTKHTMFGALLEVEMSKKSARRCGAKHIPKSTCTKHTMFRAFLEVEMLKKCTLLWCEAHFQVNMLKTHHVQSFFGSWDVEKLHAVVVRSTFPSEHVKNTMLQPLSKVQMWFCVIGARDSAPCQKWAKRKGFVACPKTMAGMGHMQRNCKDAYRVAGAVQETCSSEIEMLGGQGADFLRVVAFWSIRSVGLLRWFCLTGAALRMTWHQFFVAGAALYTDGVEKSQNAFVRGRQIRTQFSMFEGSLTDLLRFFPRASERRVLPIVGVCKTSSHLHIF